MDKPKYDYLQNIEEIKSTFSEKEANKSLENGWVLLSVAKGQEQTGPQDYMPIFKYSLGKLSKA